MGAVLEHPVTVRWRDTDALGHVNHAVLFLTFRSQSGLLLPSEPAAAPALYAGSAAAAPSPRRRALFLRFNSCRRPHKLPNYHIICLTL